jgi:hypothetical protein
MPRPDASLNGPLRPPLIGDGAPSYVRCQDTVRADLAPPDGEALLKKDDRLTRNPVVTRERIYLRKDYERSPKNGRR